LGKVLVTIDDLQALLDLLHDHDAVTEDVVVECDEGEFTEAEDMRRLSDQALADLRLRVGGMVLHLSSDRAMAVGSPELVSHVETAWARLRQTKESPPQVGLLLIAWLPPTIFVWLAALLLLVVQMSKPETSAGIWVFVLPPTVALVVSAYFVRLAVKQRRNMTWAVVKPITRQEFRDLESKKTNVPLWALLVAVAGLLVSLSFNALNYIWPNK
jgi:hypothetical protein